MDVQSSDRFESPVHGSERVLVAGCGAIGTVFACLLAESGSRVEAIGRGAHFDAVRTAGMELEGIWGAHRGSLSHAHDDGRSAAGPFDAVLVTCKAFQTDALLATLDPGCLAERGRVISLQNGLGNVERVANVFGAARTLGGRVIFGTEIARPGCARVTVEAEPTLIGHPLHEHDEGAAYWAARFRKAGAPADQAASIVAALWAKVFYNAALNPMGALLGLCYGDLPNDPERRRVMDRVMDEAFAVATAEGVRLPWPDADAYRRHFYERLLPVTARHRSSMLQDLERGRPTEIDAITGEVCRRGDSHGVDVSANRVLLALVGSRAPGGQ
ncbi:MAG TPA: ketopantoate reductase family protein [Candidatus Limnocylindrales bacterium]|nr:ketopantoate reductase family protein [Candidatus Limnocylindrales bacterium]